MSRFLDGLNDAQKEAVAHTDGPMLIIAGAGAGKTKTITHRIARLIEEGHAHPHEILAVTFTNKAAREMRERVNHLFHLHNLEIHTAPVIKTFHAFAVEVLRRFSTHLTDRNANFVILDQDDSRKLIKEAIIRAQFNPEEMEPRKIQSAISKRKSRGVPFRDARNEAPSPNEQIIFSIWGEYEKLLKESNAYDFDDLLIEVVALLSKEKEILESLRTQFRYIHIDEYQDTNRPQYELAELLAKPKNNICVVGDADQTIYTWRGAEMRNIMFFEEDFPGAKVVMLEENYRSSPVILEAANSVIANNKMRKDKKLFTQRSDVGKIEVIEANDARREAELAVDRITKLINAGKSASQMAVLYRANFQSRAFEEELMIKRIPFSVAGLAFFERKEVKDALAFLRAAFNRGRVDIIRSLEAVPRGIGKVTLVKLFSGSNEELSPAIKTKVDAYFQMLDEIKNFSIDKTPKDAIEKTLELSGILQSLREKKSEENAERIGNLGELVSYASRFYKIGEEGISEFFESIALASDQDSLPEEESSGGVRLMTIHSSKGLEFEYVFIPGLEEDLFPSAGKNDDKSELEEERRLFYVAITRAREMVTLSYAKSRFVFGEMRFSVPSRFISEIPDSVLEFTYDKTTNFLGGGYRDSRRDTDFEEETFFW